MLDVFVYGTLKPGGKYYKVYCEALAPLAIPAWIPGRLYHLPDYGYPAVGEGHDRIHGYVLRFGAGIDPDSLLAELDELEVYDPHLPLADNMYLRQRMTIETVQGSIEAWVYLMSAARLALYRGVYDPSGNWDHLLPRQPDRPSE